MSKLNSKTLTVAAVLLVVLALLFMATPLMRVSGLSGRSGFTRLPNGQSLPGGQNGFPSQGSGLPGQGFSDQTGGTQDQGNSNTPGQQFTGQPRSLLGFGFLNGMTGIIVYAIALLVSLAAAMGMFIARRWGQVLGILMAVIYLILALVSLLPMILNSFMRGLNGLSLGLSILHLVLAMAVIVLALIPAKKVTSLVIPPVASA
jgi:hypothetical protein